jgi:subtilisin-like proprotein convertase family protein
MDDMLGDSGAVTNGWTLSITTQPIIVGLANQYVLEGATSEQPFTIADDTRSANPTYQIWGTSSNEGVVPNANITFTGSGTNRTVRVKPATFGSNVVITVWVTNGDGQTVNSQFTIDVGYNLTAPFIAAIPDAAISAGTVFTTALNFSDAHTPLNQLKVGLASSNEALVPPSSMKRNNITNLWVAPVGNLTGDTTITLSVTNNDGLFTQESFVLTVNPSTVPLFANTGAIVINDVQNNGGRATPYPSTIAVDGLSGTITDVNVTLSGLGHSFPQDASILLSSPSGTNVVLMSRAGGALPISNVRVTFDDQASAPVPQSGTLTDGTYRPSDYKASDDYRTPAPLGPYSKVLSDLIGTSPNGTWSLWVQDDATPDVGNITGGWTLAITTTAGKAIVLGGRTTSLVISQVGEDIRLTVNGLPGVEYGIQTSTDMTSWSEAGTVTADDSGKAVYSIKPTAQSGLQLFRAIAK